jgi:hypothetical protein
MPSRRAQALPTETLFVRVAPALGDALRHFCAETGLSKTEAVIGILLGLFPPLKLTNCAKNPTLQEGLSDE